MAIEIHNPELEAILHQRTKAGNFSTVEDMLLQTLRSDEESWTAEERQALDEKIDHALEQVAAGKTYGPEEARQKLAAMRATHLANLGR